MSSDDDCPRDVEGEEESSHSDDEHVSTTSGSNGDAQEDSSENDVEEEDAPDDEGAAMGGSQENGSGSDATSSSSLTVCVIDSSSSSSTSSKSKKKCDANRAPVAVAPIPTTVASLDPTAMAVPQAASAEASAPAERTRLVDLAPAVAKMLAAAMAATLARNSVFTSADGSLPGALSASLAAISTRAKAKLDDGRTATNLLLQERHTEPIVPTPASHDETNALQARLEALAKEIALSWHSAAESSAARSGNGASTITSSAVVDVLRLDTVDEYRHAKDSMLDAARQWEAATLISQKFAALPDAASKPTKVEPSTDDTAVLRLTEHFERTLKEREATIRATSAKLATFEALCRAENVADAAGLRTVLLQRKGAPLPTSASTSSVLASTTTVSGSSGAERKIERLLAEQDLARASITAANAARDAAAAEAKSLREQVRRLQAAQEHVAVAPATGLALSSLFKKGQAIVDLLPTVIGWSVELVPLASAGLGRAADPSSALLVLRSRLGGVELELEVPRCENATPRIIRVTNAGPTLVKLGPCSDVLALLQLLATCKREVAPERPKRSPEHSSTQPGRPQPQAAAPAASSAAEVPQESRRGTSPAQDLFASAFETMETAVDESVAANPNEEGEDEDRSPELPQAAEASGSDADGDANCDGEDDDGDAHGTDDAATADDAAAADGAAAADDAAAVEDDVVIDEDVVVDEAPNVHDEGENATDAEKEALEDEDEEEDGNVFGRPSVEADDGPTMSAE